MNTKTSNYSEEQVVKLIAQYNRYGNEGLESIAEGLGKSVRSVRSKLVREGVYVAQTPSPAATTQQGPTKAQLLTELEAVVGFDCSGMAGATKPALQTLIDHIKS